MKECHLTKYHLTKHHKTKHLIPYNSKGIPGMHWVILGSTPILARVSGLKEYTSRRDTVRSVANFTALLFCVPPPGTWTGDPTQSFWRNPRTQGL